MDRKDLIMEIVNKISRGDNVVLIAPMGWGKTITSFEVANELAQRGYKVAYLTPTLTLALKKWHELISRTNQSVILTAGAQQYCVYGFNIPQRFCSRCRLRSQDKDIPLQRHMTFEDIDRLAGDDKCGYWLQENIMRKFNIVVGHYGRLRKVVNLAHVIILDEIHEFYLPHITALPLNDVAQILEVEKIENVAVVKELVEEKLANTVDLVSEDKLYTLYQMIQKTCWIEGDQLNCMDLLELPKNTRMFGVTATPPPGWPPEGWGEKIEIKPTIKAKAFIETTAKFYYKDKYEGAALLLNLVVRWLRREYNVEEIAVFATSSLREKLQYSLPPGVQLFPAGG
jgi:hypothetical protein